MPSELEKLKEDIASLRSKMECYGRELSMLTERVFWLESLPHHRCLATKDGFCPGRDDE